MIDEPPNEKSRAFAGETGKQRGVWQQGCVKTGDKATAAAVVETPLGTHIKSFSSFEAYVFGLVFGAKEEGGRKNSSCAASYVFSMGHN